MNVQLNKTNSGQNKILNYIDIVTLKEILDAFMTTTNLVTNIVDTEGKPLFSRNDIKGCSKFCSIILGLQNGFRRCQGAYMRAGKQAAALGEPYIFRCPSGLIEWAAPIIIDGEHIGTIICGQVLMWEPEDFFWVELREMNKDIISDFQVLFEAAKELPIVSGTQVQAAAYMIYVVAKYIMQAGWKNINQAKELATLSSLYYEEIKKNNSSKDELDLSACSTIDENEILLQLQKKEKKLKAYFQNLIAMLTYESKNSIPVMRSKMIELLVVPSRVMSRVGMGSVYSSNIINKYLSPILESNSIERLSTIMIEATDEYLKCMNECSNKPLHPKVNNMMQYIQKNYMNKLSLETIAESVYLSPSYAGKIFKKDTGMPIMTYTLRTRIEKAKNFLMNPHYQIEEIANNVGFLDASYFTKVFKKYEGITPTQFRKYNNEKWG